MAGRYLKSSSGRLRVLAALLALASAGTAIASSGLAPCGDAISDSRAIAANQLHATNVNHEVNAEELAPAPLDTATAPLIPAKYPEAETAAETTLLQVYEENDEATASEAAPARKSDDDAKPLIKARVPGVSDGDLARYKRHMYRRDI